MEPLEQWICDNCGEIIDGPERGYVVWRYDEDMETDFQLVHQQKCDNSDKYPLSCELSAFLGTDGLNYLLTFIDSGPAFLRRSEKTHEAVNMNDIDHLIRRLHIPYYEEGRLYFDKPEVQRQMEGFQEHSPYTQDFLRRLVTRYGNEL